MEKPTELVVHISNRVPELPGIRMVLIISLLCLSALIMTGCTETGFYVSPSGSDDNPGTRSKPFLTITKAQEAIRTKEAGGWSGNRNVWLADGTYSISSPLTFSATDSGKDHNRIKYKALKGARPVISGGVEVSGWQHRGGGVWVAEINSGIADRGFRELFIDGKRATRARHPNSEYLRVAEVGADRRTNFRFNTGDFPTPVNPQQTELVLIHDWSISRILLADVDDENNRLTAVDSIGAKSLDFFNLDNWEKNPRYYLENDLAFLDAPSEWFFDNHNALLYLMLPEDSDPAQMKVIVPVTDSHLVIMEGSEQQRVRNISFEDITFSYCSWLIPEKGYAGIQACHFDSRPAADGWSVVPAAVYVKWAENCTFIRCRFTQLGGSAIWLSAGSRDCTIADSHFEDISANAIMLGDGRDRKVNGVVWWKAAPEQTANGNTVINNTINAIGKQFYGAVGIWCGFTAKTIISGNHLHNLPYTGISVGWEWSPISTPCRENHLIGNHIHHIMQTLSDGGGIYMLGLQPGSTITSNLIHDVTVNAGRAESNGMFLDEGATDLIISDNIIYNIAKSPLRFHRATTNLVRNNVLSCNDGIPPVQYNDTREEVITLENNLILQDSNSGDRAVLEKAVERFKGRN
jgi:hypothetical protein